MTTADNSSVLQDVVAYVDVWSSDRMANFSKPFIQQLQSMGAQVTKTFNKQVTHVVFGHGHSATWRKAKSNNVQLVSVLWVGRCFEDGVHADEELYPAVNESNPVLKNKKHRCMQPKDSPEKTPENGRRFKKKIDKLMKGFVLKQPLTLDVSPIIVDEETGIVYSPALKRSDYMAQRLKDMKEKREHLSPTASQMLESCTPTELKPSLGSTPTVLKLTYDESDPDPSTSAAAPTSAYSPHKQEGTTHRDFSDHSPPEQGRSTASETPWLSPCCDVPKGISSLLKCPDFTGEEDKDRSRAKKSRTSVRKKAEEKDESIFVFECLSPDKRTDNNRIFQKENRRSHIKSCSSSPNKSEKGKLKMTENKSSADAVNSPSSCLKPISEAVMKVPRETFASPLLKKVEQKTPKRARLSISSLVKSFSISGDSKRVSSGWADGDDDVFEDYFSTPDRQHKSNKQTLLQPEKTEDFPFEFEFGPKKRKQNATSEPNSKKKKLKETQGGKNHNQQSEAGREPVAAPQADLSESLPAPESQELMARRRRQSTLPFTSTGTTRTALKRTGASVHPLTLTEDSANNDAPAESLESRGGKHTAEASVTELPSEGEEDRVKQVWKPQRMVTTTKAMRTLVMTSMPTEKQQVVTQVVKALGGFTIVDEVCESTTHVVSGGHRRTLNILLGIARGCWVLSFEWILWCLEQRQWIPEEPYELSDQFPAAQICRLQRHLSAGEHQQDLFQSLPAIFVSQHSQPPTHSLVELIQLCGGTVCKTVRQAGICIGRYSGRRPEGSRILSEQWVLDSITQLKQLSYEGYDLG